MSQFGHNLRKGRLVNDATTSFNTSVKNMSQFGHNLRKGRLVNDATTSFNTTVLPDK